MKQCRSCFEILPLSDFYKGAKNRGGVRSRCKFCMRGEAADWRESLSEEEKQQRLESILEWKEENPEIVKEHQKKWRNKRKSTAASAEDNQTPEGH